jgi:3-oxoacyl-[acyl-carrier-protein] synthase-3
VYSPRITAEMVAEGRHYPHMDGRFVFKHAIQRMPEVANEALERNGLKVHDVSLWLFHQANLRINEVVASQLGIPPERTSNNIDRYGNCSAAAIPILLDECVRAGRLRPGDLVGMAGFGSGFTWGSALVRW